MTAPSFLLQATALLVGLSFIFGAFNRAATAAIVAGIGLLCLGSVDFAHWWLGTRQLSDALYSSVFMLLPAFVLAIVWKWRDKS